MSSVMSYPCGSKVYQVSSPVSRVSSCSKVSRCSKVSSGIEVTQVSSYVSGVYPYLFKGC